MALESIKKRLNIDQRNILVCTVVAVGTGTVTVRKPDGSTVIAGTDSGTYSPSDLVEVRTDGKMHVVSGAAPLASLGGVLVNSV